jgi:acyl-CoA synthetase (AMP-forming)/AMP-acid ligase II
LTYAELDRLIQNVESHYRVSDPSGVGFVFSHDQALDVLINMLALWRLGRRVVFLNNRLSAEILAQQARIAGVDISDPYLYQKGFSWIESDLAHRDGSWFADSSEFVIFTSGSGGVSQGVIHTPGSLVSHLDISTRTLCLRAQDKWLVSLPCFHIGGLLIPLRMWWVGGGCFFPADLKRGTFLDLLLDNSDISHVSLIPEMLLELVELPGALEALRRCRRILLGGTRLSNEVRKCILGLELPVWIGYGSSELCSHVALGPLLDVEGSAGKILKGVKLSFDPSDRIGIQYEGLFKGYCGKPSRDKGETYWTSDYGHINDQGELIVAGRIDEIIISGGEKISCSHICDTINQVLGGDQCAVVGFDHPRWGQRPVAFIQLKEWHVQQKVWMFSQLVDSTNQIIAHLAREIRNALPRIWQPDILVICECLPRTALGKVAYGSLKKEYADVIRAIFNKGSE